jgi:hypothetical protein
MTLGVFAYCDGGVEAGAAGRVSVEFVAFKCAAFVAHSIVAGMKLLREIPEAAMVAAFLKAELTSVRFSAKLKKVMSAVGVAEQVIAEPNIESEADNALRAQVLGDYRGYGQNREMFTDVPTDLTWYEAELPRGEIGNLHYVDYSYWNELTDHTHLVKRAVVNIEKGKIVFEVPNDRFLALAGAIRQGKHDFGPMILWGKSADGPLAILEGHLRATAFGLAGDEAPEVVRVIVGLGESG